MRLLCRPASMCFFTFCQQGSNYRVTTAGESSVTASGVTRYCLQPMLASPSISLYCLLAVFVLCSVTLTWDSPLFQPYHEHYLSRATFHGVDVFTEDLNSPTAPEQFMERFYVCYGRDGRKTYFKKQDETYFSNRRFWIITSSGKFIASMKTC